MLLRFRYTVPALVLAFCFLGVSAAIGDGALPLVWDEPLQRGIEGSRTPFLSSFFEAVSELGGTKVVLIGLGVLFLVVWRRCRSVAWVLLAATVARPLLEWALKAAIDRPRPELEPLLPGRGPSFPSGHVMAAIALWGLVPPIIALITERRRWWWWSTAVSGIVIGLVAASRVYLGVHWVTDVTGALVLGCLYLLAVERLLDWHHHRRPCRPAGAVANQPEVATVPRVAP